MNEIVKGPLFIIEQTAIMIGLLLKKKKKLSLETCYNFTRKKDIKPSYLVVAVPFRTVRAEVSTETKVFQVLHDLTVIP